MFLGGNAGSVVGASSMSTALPYTGRAPWVGTGVGMSSSPRKSASSVSARSAWWRSDTSGTSSSTSGPLGTSLSPTPHTISTASSSSLLRSGRWELPRCFGCGSEPTADTPVLSEPVVVKLGGCSSENAHSVHVAMSR